MGAVSAFKKYLCFVEMGMKRGFERKWDILGRVIFYGVILVIFSKLWTSVDLLAVGNSKVHTQGLIWYLAISEWIVLSVPLIYIEIESEIRRGDLLYFEGKPISYPTMKISEGIGELLPYLGILGCAGVIFAWALSGSLPEPPFNLLKIVPIGILAGIVSLIVQVAIGLSAHWIQSATPVYWLWQKVGYVLGGVMLPLPLYPDALEKIARASPFPVLLSGAAEGVLYGDSDFLINTMGMLFFWCAASIFLVIGVFQKCQDRMSRDGG